MFCFYCCIFRICDRFVIVILWSVLYGFLFVFNGGIMCLIVISFSLGFVMFLKKKLFEF